MKVGFTGTQDGMTDKQKAKFKALLTKLKAKSLSHGDCIGADEDAHNIARKLGIKAIIHPPLDSKKRAFCKEYTLIFPAKEYLQRNKAIVDLTDTLIATPKGEEVVRSGTWSTIRYAVRKGKKATIIYPNGDTEKR